MTLDLEDAIRDTLQARAAALVVRGDLAHRIELRAARRQRRRRAVGAAVAAAAVLVVTGVGIRVGTTGGPAQVTVGSGQSEGSWQPLPPAPIDGRSSAYSVWTGHEMLIWAGDDETQALGGPFVEPGQRYDGAAYNPSTHTWRRIAAAPFPIANDVKPVAVWTGTEMLVFGARSSLADTAAMAYNPATNRWRVLATPPPGLNLFQASAVWAGHQALIVGGATEKVIGAVTASLGAVTASQRPNASYDPTTNTWKVIAASPLGPLQDETLAWTGHDMLVWGGSNPSGPLSTHEGAAYDPRTNTWQVLPQAPIATRSDASAAWTGHELLIWGGALATVSAGDGAAYEPTTNTWRALAPANLPPLIPNTTLWTGDRLLIIGGRIRRVVNGNNVADQITSDGAAYTPAANTWAVITPEPTALCFLPNAVWTGHTAIIWGGQPCPPGNQTPGPPLASTDRGAVYTP